MNIQRDGNVQNVADMCADKVPNTLVLHMGDAQNTEQVPINPVPHLLEEQESSTLRKVTTGWSVADVMSRIPTNKCSLE